MPLSIKLQKLKCASGQWKISLKIAKLFLGKRRRIQNFLENVPTWICWKCNTITQWQEAHRCVVPSELPCFSKSTTNIACRSPLKYCAWKLLSKLFKCSTVKHCISGFLLLKKLQIVMCYSTAILIDLILQMQHEWLSHENLLNHIKENKHVLQRDLLVFLRHFIAY